MAPYLPSICAAGRRCSIVLAVLGLAGERIEGLTGVWLEVRTVARSGGADLDQQHGLRVKRESAIVSGILAQSHPVGLTDDRPVGSPHVLCDLSDRDPPVCSPSRHVLPKKRWASRFWP